MEKHGKILSWKVMAKSWKMGRKNKVMEIKNILKKSCTFFTADHESRTIYLQEYCSVLAMGGVRFMF